MNLSSISTKSLAGRLLRLPLRLVPDGMPMPILQGPMRGRRWLAGALNHGCWLGSYETDTQERIGALIGAGDVVYDVGANAGFYTLLAATLVGARGRVVSFEPVPSNLEVLRRHIALNDLVNVEVIEAAVADRDGIAAFSAEGGHGATARLSESGNLRVRVTTLDTLRSEGRIPAPTLIKIDVEGAEYAVLRGAERLLRDTLPYLIVELHTPEMDRLCPAFLRNLGYAIEPFHAADTRAVWGDTIPSEVWGAFVAMPPR